MKQKAASTVKYKQLLELVYPVGSLFINVNNINPNTLMPTTKWELISNDTFIASKGLIASGSYGGSNDAIVVSHSHSISHTHTKGSMKITGTVKTVLGNDNINSGALYLTYTGGGSAWTTGGGQYSQINFDTDRGGWSGNTSEPTNSNSGITGSSGTNKNMPKYLACYIWKRLS